MHDVADSSSNSDHLTTVSLAHTNNATQAPVSKICISFIDRSNRAQHVFLYLPSSPANSNCFYDMIIITQNQQTIANNM